MYLAVANAYDFIWIGFGKTEQEAVEALLKQYNDFHVGEEPATEETIGCPIRTLVWIDGSGVCLERV